MAVGQQLHSESVNRLVRHALHEVYSGGDVSPLIASANLANAPVVSVQVEIVICLHALIRELGKAHTVFRMNTLLNAVLRQHTLNTHISTGEAIIPLLTFLRPEGTGSFPCPYTSHSC